MDTYFHSVRLDKDKCRGCTNCIKRCPTQAIRVRNGKAVIILSWQGHPVSVTVTNDYGYVLIKLITKLCSVLDLVTGP